MSIGAPPAEANTEAMAMFTIANLVLKVMRRYRRFYVDATGGSDANNGRSPDTAWQTIGKVNGYAHFRAGDTILFKRGETWAGTCLIVPRSNLKFKAYGTGAKPIIDGSDTVDCVSGNGQDHLSFTNIEVTQGLDFGFVFDTETNITLTDCDAHDCGNDNIIFSDCSKCSVTGGASYNVYTRLGDDRHISAIEVKDACHDITISQVEIYGCTAAAFAAHYGSGVAIHSHVGTAMPYNITVTGCNIHDQLTRCFGIRVNNAASATMGDRNIVIRNNTIRDGAYGGIQVNSTAGTNFRTNGVTIRDNRILLNSGQYGIGVFNSTVINIYRNVITNNSSAQGGQNANIQQSTSVNFYNNTLYSNYNDFFFSLVMSGATTANVNIKNNIIGGAIANMMNIAVAAATGTTGLVIDYNLYQYTGAGNRWQWLGVNSNYTNWRAANSNDANSPTRGNPLFTNPAGEDFTLQAGSPAIDAGVVIPGITDGYLGTAPDCGYQEAA